MGYGPHLNLGLNRILRLRADYKYNSTIAIRSDRISDDYPKFTLAVEKVINLLSIVYLNALLFLYVDVII